jgi:hypothetical protein
MSSGRIRSGFWIVACAALINLWGCGGPVEIPAYISVPEAWVVHKGDTSKHVVPDVWVYQFPQYTGTFTLPVEFPLLDLEKNRVLFSGGVWLNQTIGNHYLYPFWQFDTAFFNLQPNTTISYRPVFKYFKDTTIIYPFEEDFERNDTRLVPYNSSVRQPTILRNTGGAFRGNRYGRIQFSGVRPDTFEVVSNSSFTLPQDGKEVWAEVTYRGTIKFGLALLALGSGSNQVLSPVLVPSSPFTDEWQSCFFRLTPDLLNFTPGTRFKLYLVSQSDGNGQRLDLDEIRILHFNPNL